MKELIKKEEEQALVRAEMGEIELAKDSLKTFNSLLNTAILILKDAVQDADDLVRLRSPIKDYGTTLANIIKAQTILENGGVQKVQIHKREEKIDWSEIIKTSIKAKKEHGEDFDEHDFAKKIVDAEFKNK